VSLLTPFSSTTTRAALRAPIWRGLTTAGFIALLVIAQGYKSGQVSDPATVVHVSGKDAADFGDPRILAGCADNVFFGRVDAQLDVVAPEDPFPQTLFAVSVTDPLKGTVAGVVIVAQWGGRDKDGDFVVINDAPLLRPGATYLFATRTQPNLQWHTPAVLYGERPADDPELQKTLRAEMIAAIGNEVPFLVPNPATREQ